MFFSRGPLVDLPMNYMEDELRNEHLEQDHRFRISLTNIQMSHSPPVIIVMKISNANLKKP
jgi:hypothetical protein